MPKKILIIAGHGEGDPGACSKWGQEADYTRELATLVQKSVGSNAAVTMYDQKKNCYTQSKKGNVPNYAAYDFVLEIHFNAKSKKDPDGDGRFTGIGGYVHPNNAGKSIARAILDAVKGIGFKEWLLDTSTGLLNLNRAQAAGAKYFLLETAFIDDGDDMTFYCARKSEFAQQIAGGMLKGLGVSGSASRPDSEGPTLIDTYYRVRKSWKNAKSQIFAGSKEGAIRACKVGYNVYDPSGKRIYSRRAKGAQASGYLNMSEEKVVEAIGPLYTADEKKSGILACVSMAQGILESGYLQTDLAQAGNNVHGMKTSLSGNTWKGTTWDGVSCYEKESPEVENGKTVMQKSKFRVYDSMEQSITDHSAYLAGAMNGNALRYPGIAAEKNYSKAVDLIAAGGYATDPDYAKKLKNIIKKWNLTRFNASGSETKGEEQTIRITCGKVQLLEKKGDNYIYTGKTVAAGVYTLVDVANGLGELKSGAGYIPVCCVEFC